VRIIGLVVAETGNEMPLDRAVIGGQLQDIAVNPVAQALVVRADDDEERRVGAARIGNAWLATGEALRASQFSGERPIWPATSRATAPNNRCKHGSAEGRKYNSSNTVSRRTCAVWLSFMARNFSELLLRARSCRLSGAKPTDFAHLEFFGF
jgi:hypothetical protein